MFRCRFWCRFAVLASAVAQYHAHMGSLPTALTDLTREVTNSRGEMAGPFLSAIPSPPRGFTRYHYRVRADGTYTKRGTAVSPPCSLN